MRGLLALLAVAGCGDNTVPCEPASPGPVPCASEPCVDLFVVAHPDDDLLFMNPDVRASIAAGRQVVTVVVTAGELGDPGNDRYWKDRERGLLAAYSYMATDEGAVGYAVPPPGGWHGASETIAGVDVTTYRRDGLELAFLRLGDYQTQCLWENTTGCSSYNTDALPYLAFTKPCTAGVDDDCVGTTREQAVSKDALVAVLRELIVREGATFVGTLDSTHLYFDALGAAGGDTDGYLEYWDHYYTALFATAAAQQAAAQLAHPLQLGAYRGYTIARESADVAAAEACDKQRVFEHYAIYDAEIAPSHGSPVLHGDYALAAPQSWQTRELSTRSRGGDFVLETGERCLASDGRLGDCAAAARWTTTAHGELAGPAGCLAPGGLVPCDGTHALFVLDDGQIRAGAHCLTSALAAAECAGTVGDDGHATGVPAPDQRWLVR